MLLNYLVALALAAYVLSQARKPDRWFGRIFARLMKRGHARMTEWGLQHLNIDTGFQILDIGCGGGRQHRGFALL